MIICNVGKDNWDGTQPISWLTEYYIKFFRNLSDEIEVFEQLLSISRKVDDIIIEIDYSEKTLKDLAFIDGLRNKIVIEETFLSFLWTTIFSTIVDFDELIQKRALGRKEDLLIQEKSKSVFAYAMSLLSRYRTWDTENLPNPAKHCKAYENYINITTMFFQYAFMFIILHELSHGLLGHDVPFSEKKIEDEYDADLLAFQLLSESTLLEEDYEFKRDGAILGLCCILMIDSGKNIDHYPDTADRIKALLEYSKPKIDDWIWGMCGMVIQNWLKFNIDIETKIPKAFPNYIAYFEFMHKMMKEVKIT